MTLAPLTTEAAMDLSAGAPLDVAPHVCSESTRRISHTAHHVVASCTVCGAAAMVRKPVGDLIVDADQMMAEAEVAADSHLADAIGAVAAIIALLALAVAGCLG
jgi:hypothetical protein